MPLRRRGTHALPVRYVFLAYRRTTSGDTLPTGEYRPAPAVQGGLVVEPPAVDIRTVLCRQWSAGAKRSGLHDRSASVRGAGGKSWRKAACEIWIFMIECQRLFAKTVAERSRKTPDGRAAFCPAETPKVIKISGMVYMIAIPHAYAHARTQPVNVGRGAIAGKPTILIQITTGTDRTRTTTGTAKK